MIFRGFTALATYAVAAGLMLAGQASATVHHLTYEGVVTSALDSTGEFGPGADLVGKAFTAQAVYDDAKAGATYFGDVYYDTYFGSGAANPFTVTIQLNGVTRSFGATSGQDYRLDRTLQPGCLSDCTDAYFKQNATDEYTQNGFYTLNYINFVGRSSDGTISGLAHAAPNFTNPSVELNGYVNLFEQDIYTLASRHSAAVNFKITSISEGVPEPDAWALMLMGFGGMGVLLRRRRAAAAAPAGREEFRSVGLG